jgi:hypothetical protein
MPDRSEPRIELIPDTTHCIETVARAAYDDALALYFRSEGESPELEQRIELLRVFLESADFPELRRVSEAHLTAGTRVRFVLRPGDVGAQAEMEILARE